MGLRRIAFAFLFMPLTSGCACFSRNAYPPATTDDVKMVYLVSNGWHADLVLPREEIPKEVWPEELPQTRFVEVGWGSGVFYMAPRVTPAIAVRALFWSESVLHVAGFNGPPEAVFPENHVIAVPLSRRGFEELCRTIHQSYELDERGRPIPLGCGLYAESQFYRARGKYYFPNTCNVWTARALASAGCPIEPAVSSSAQAVVIQAAIFGRQVVRHE